MIDPQQIIDGMVARGIPYNAAVALAGNMAVESGFNPGINEIAPTVPGSRGGYGLIQWTGPRRRQLESFAEDRGANVSDMDTQLDFLSWELANTERGAADAIYAASTPDEAARLVSERFLRPGIPHLDRRISETMRLAGGAPSNALTTAGAPAQPAPPAATDQNALAQRPEFQLADARQDPMAFMSKRRFGNNALGGLV